MANGNDHFRNDKAIFDAYVSLRKVAQNYQLEGKLAIPRVVFVGETSAGKSMLIQNFLRFPCAFSHRDVGTRCPILYRLRYNPKLADGVIEFKKPATLQRAEDLGEHLREVMNNIERGEGFSLDEYVIHIESNEYKDFEILDVPGLIGGVQDNEHRAAVERITERYVRDPNFLIVQLKEASQIGVNSNGLRRIRELCILDPAPCGSPLPPRLDYERSTITIQTKMDIFMDGHKDGTHANEDMRKLIEFFNQKTFFVSMIFDVYDFSRNDYVRNVQYIKDLPELEHYRVDQWIEEMNDKAHMPKGESRQFDVPRLRPLIGINIVRNYIHDMWLRAFCEALPKIQQVLNQLVQEQSVRFESALLMLEQQSVDSIRASYLKYIETFRSTITDYVAYRAEINILFKHELFGRTYKQIEDEYNQWSRKKPLKWSIYRTSEQLAKAPHDQLLYSLPLRYVGARHFERLRQVFSYMILTYQPTGHQIDWYESAQSFLHGVCTDAEDLEKGVRESLYTHIRETFFAGLCWLTQMYAFLIDHFAQHVSSVLLSPDGQFAHLAIGHTQFLSRIQLEYHTITRRFLRRAVESVKHARYTKMLYVVHDVVDKLRTLVNSIPPRIRNDQQESRRSSENPLNLIFGSGDFLPANRQPQTTNYLPATRNVIIDLYTTVRGQLLHDITTSFFAYVVAEMQRYNTISNSNALQFRINRMSDAEIARMAHLQLDECQQQFMNILQQLKALEEARDEIEHAIRLFDGKNAVIERDRKHEARVTLDKKREQRYRKIVAQILDDRTAKNAKEDDDDGMSDSDWNDGDERGLADRDGDQRECDAYLLALYQQHDKEDLELGFLHGDRLENNEHIIQDTQKQTLYVSRPVPLAPSVVTDKSTINQPGDNPKPVETSNEKNSEVPSLSVETFVGNEGNPRDTNKNNSDVPLSSLGPVANLSDTTNSGKKDPPRPRGNSPFFSRFGHH